MNLMIVPGIVVCSSFLISVCMFIVSKALLISFMSDTANPDLFVAPGFVSTSPTFVRSSASHLAGLVEKNKVNRVHIAVGRSF